MPYPPRLSWCDHPNYSWWDRSYSSSLWNLLQYPYISSLLCPNIFPSIVLSKTLSLCSYFGVRDQVSHPRQTTYKYTECPRRNVPDFGRVFLMLKYTDITQNTYVQSWTVTEIKAREKCVLLAVPRSVPGSRDVIPICCALSVLVYSRLKRVPRCDCTSKVLGQLWHECECFSSSI